MSLRSELIVKDGLITINSKSSIVLKNS
jgi:hypothetical protein